MNTFRFDRLGFEISLPEEWREVPDTRPGMGGPGNRAVSFVGDDRRKRAIHVAVGALARFETEPTFDDTLSFFEGYVKRNNYSQAAHGKLLIQGREFFWGQYLMPEGVLVRKYSATVNRIEYIITCQYGLEATASDKEIRRAEREYDDILSTLKITGTTTPESLHAVSSAERGPAVFKVAVVCLLSAAWIAAFWTGWFEDRLEFTPTMAWLWTIAGGVLGSSLVFQNSRRAGLPLLPAAILGLGVLAGWASILHVTGLL